jgi:hypothetical protein
MDWKEELRKVNSKIEINTMSEMEKRKHSMDALIKEKKQLETLTASVFSTFQCFQAEMESNKSNFAGRCFSKIYDEIGEPYVELRIQSAFEILFHISIGLNTHILTYNCSNNGRRDSVRIPVNANTNDAILTELLRFYKKATA